MRSTRARTLRGKQIKAHRIAGADLVKDIGRAHVLLIYLKGYMYTLVIRSDLNANIARVRVLGFAKHEGKRRVGIPVGSSSGSSSPTDETKRVL